MKPFKAYKKEIKRLLLKSQTGGGWDIKYTTKGDFDDSVAYVESNVPYRYATFAFNKNECKTVKNARQYARHEFGHFLVAKLSYIGSCRYLTESELDDENEDFARIMEKLLK